MTMTTTTELDTADEVAMYLGGGLIVLAIPVLGVATTLAGAASPLYVYEGAESAGQAYSAAAVPDGAEVVSAPLVDPHLRAAMVALGLAIWATYAVYRVATPRESTASRRASAGTTD